jgi:hypothetical protein
MIGWQDEMMNVISFRKMAPRSRGPGSLHSPENAGADSSELVLRMADLQSKAKGEVFRAVLMLDLAAQHAHEIAKKIRDPATKQNFDAHISSIEQLLQLARDMAVKL